MILLVKSDTFAKKCISLEILGENITYLLMQEKQVY